MGNIEARKAVVAIFLSAVMIGGGFVVYFDYFGDRQESTSPGIAMSNISLDLSIRPSAVLGAGPGSSNANFTGAIVEIWPTYFDSSTGPSIQTVTNVTPMVTLWVNSSWNTSFKLPYYFPYVVQDWKNYFGGIHGGKTALIAKISYISSDGSLSDTAYTYTVSLPYDPFDIANGNSMHFEVHPNLELAAKMSVPENETSAFSNPIYGNSPPMTDGLPDSGVSGAVFSPEHLPFPGGGDPGWTWWCTDIQSLNNVMIPISYLNETEKDVGTQVIDGVFIGSVSFSTSFSMASGYNYSGVKSFVMGNTTQYVSGLYFGSDGVMTNSMSSLSNSSVQDGVLAIKGSAAIWRYRWVELGQTGQIIKTSNDYSTDMSITSLNELHNEFHISNYYAGYENIKKNVANYGNFTSTQFMKLNQTLRYEMAFGLYFNGSGPEELFGNMGQIHDETLLAPQESIQWSTIYSNISASTSNAMGDIEAGLGILVSLVSVELAMAAVPFGDAVAIPAVVTAMVGFGLSVASAFQSGMICVSSSALIYVGYIQNSGNGAGGGTTISVHNWFTPASININGETYQIPTNYAIIER